MAMPNGAICGGPSLEGPVIPSPKGYWPAIYVLRGEWYRPGARCYLDGKYVSEVTALLVPAALGYFEVDGVEYPNIIGQTVGAVVGQCKRHGWVEAEYDEIDWGDYDG